MKKKMYKSKKQWVVAGVTTAGLLLAPSVLADEINSANSPALSPTIDQTSPAKESLADKQELSETSPSSEGVRTDGWVTSTESDLALNSDKPTLSSSDDANTRIAPRSISGNDSLTPTPNPRSATNAQVRDLSKVDTTDIVGRSHVENVGWQNSVSAPQLFGTTGQSKRLEALELRLGEDAAGLGDIIYQSHVENIGWQSAVKTGEVSGTTGQSKRLEAINLRLTAELATHFDIYYRAHVENYGWLGWTKNGGNAGTEGLSLRLEAIEVQLVSKGSHFRGDTRRSFVKQGDQVANIFYRSYIESIGWDGEVSNGRLSGSFGKNRQLESLGIRLDSDYFGHVSYETHIQNIGWVSPVKDGALSGQEGSGKQIEAIKISLVGDISRHYDIYYRVHSQNKGWLGWTKNGLAAGTEGFSLGVEGIEVTLVKKGAQAPGTAENAYLKKIATAPRTYPMPYFNQRDPRWAGKYYGNYSMGDAGCVPASLGMIFSALTGQTVLPTAVADWLYHHTDEFNKTVIGTKAPGIVKASDAWGLKATNLSSFDSIVSALAAGEYVLAGVQNNVFVSSGSHEIVLKGYNNGKVHVTDPYTQSLSGWYDMSYLFNTKSTDKDDTALGLPFFKISRA